MTEMEMCAVLGMLVEPEQNRVQMEDPILQMEMLNLQFTFSMIQMQKESMGSVNPDVWCEFLPWHSLN